MAASAAASRGCAGDSAGSARPNRRANQPSSARQPAGVLRARIGPAQVERLRRRALVLRGGAEARDPADIGRRVLFDLRRPASRSANAPRRAPQPEPVMIVGPTGTARTAARTRSSRGVTIVLPLGAKTWK